jgi:hypothetical protein
MMAKKARKPADLWKMSIVGHAEVDPRTLVPHPQNWRTHTPAQDAAVTGSLHDLGWIRSVIVNEVTGHVLDGHERLALALAHEVAMIPVEYVQLPEALEPLALLAIDPTAAMAGASAESLHALLEQVSTGEAGLQAMLRGLAEEYGVVPPAGVDPPEIFQEYGEDIETEHTCPKCGYQWSGGE